MNDLLTAAHKVIREARQAIEAAGPPIPWTDEQKADIHQLEEELSRREKAKEIGKLDSRKPQSMTDALQTYNHLHQAYQAIRLAQAQLEWRRSFDDGTWQLTAQDPSGIFQNVLTGPRVQTMYYAHKAIREAQTLLASRGYTPKEYQQHQQQGWRGEPCQDAAHHGQIGDRCADCGRRVAPERAAHTIIRQALLLLGYSFSDDEYSQHVANVERKLGEWRTAGKDTRTLHGIVGARGETRWSPARRRQQNALVRNLYQQWAGTVPAEGKAMVMGGLGGAGKGKIQRDPNAPLDTRNYFQIDPDAIKQEMATRGMIPQVEGLSPMEASPLAHEEASELTKRLARMAYHDKRNVLWDITMSGENSVAQRLQDMRKAGYNQVDGVFVDADPATARERANRRHRLGEESYREGQGMGGRVVPQNVSTSNNPTPGSPYLSRNAEVFNKIRPHFDNSLVYNVTGEQPAITSASGSRWANSLQKAGAR